MQQGGEEKHLHPNFHRFPLVEIRQGSDRAEWRRVEIKSQILRSAPAAWDAADQGVVGIRSRG